MGFNSAFKGLKEYLTCVLRPTNAHDTQTISLVIQTFIEQTGRVLPTYNTPSFICSLQLNFHLFLIIHKLTLRDHMESLRQLL